MSKHTPEPWIIEALPRVGTNAFIFTKRMSANEFVNTDWEANRRLMETAPELLRELKLAVELIPPRYKETAERIRVLAAKAEGK